MLSLPYLIQVSEQAIQNPASLYDPLSTNRNLASEEKPMPLNQQYTLAGVCVRVRLFVCVCAVVVTVYYSCHMLLYTCFQTADGRVG